MLGRQSIIGERSNKAGNRLLYAVIATALFFGCSSSVAEQGKLVPDDIPASITLNSDLSYCGGRGFYSLKVDQIYNDLNIVSVSLYVEIDQQLKLMMPLPTTPTQGEDIVFCLPEEYVPFTSVSIKYGQDSCGVSMNVFASKSFVDLQPDIPKAFDQNL